MTSNTDDSIRNPEEKPHTNEEMSGNGLASNMTCSVTENKKNAGNRFWVGVFVGMVAAVMAGSGAGLYLYSSTNQILVDAREKLEQLLNKQLDRQQKQFSTMVEQQVSKQYQIYAKLSDDARRRINTNFDQRFADVVTTRLNGIIDVRAHVEKDEAAQGYQKAVGLVQEGQINEAGIYISNSLNKDPSVDHLSGYVNTVMEWALHGNDVDKQLAAQILSELTAFATEYLVRIDVEDIGKGRVVVSEILNQQRILIEAIEQQELELLVAAGNAAMNQWEQLGQIPDTDSDDILMAYADQLMAIQSDIDGANVVLSKPQWRETLASSSERLQQVNILRQVLDSVAQAETCLEQARQVEERESRQLLLVQAESIANQLLLRLPALTPSVKGRVLDLKMASDEAAKAESVAYSEKILVEMDKKLKEHSCLPFKKPPKKEGSKHVYQTAIDDLGSLVRELSVLAQNITDQTVMSRAVEKIAEVNSARQRWVEVQCHEYSLWATETAQGFYKKYRKELGINSDEEKIKKKLLKWFGPVDLRLLSGPASQTYQEVFNLFYAELNAEQKIAVSAQLVTYKKRPLSYF